MPPAPKPASKPLPLPKAAHQLLAAAAAGVVVAVVVALIISPGLGVLAGYDAAALGYTAWVLHQVWPLDANRTAQHAAREDPTRRVTDAVLLLASVASLAAVGVVIAQSQSSHGFRHGLEIGLGVASVAISWALVHTVFMLAYARLYYADQQTDTASTGGIDFKDRKPPPYTDFAYVAFTIGMTFQVSDTDFQHPDFRQLALRHALLAYLFGAVILAATINLIAGLAG